MRAETMRAPAPTLEELSARLEEIGSSVRYLVERQRKQEELFTEAAPILKEVMSSATRRLDALEKRGTFEKLGEVAAIGERVLDAYSADDVRQLGDAVVGILDTVRAMTQPEVLQVMGEASAVLARADTAEPLGLVGMVRATRSEDVQRGMAVMMELLRKVGHGAQAAATGRARTALRLPAAKGEPAPAPAKRRLGIERPQQAPPVPVAERPVAGCAVPARPAVAATVIDGIAFTADGHLVDPLAWSRELGERLAAAQGIVLSGEHWRIVEFCREDFLKTKASPNIRRITQSLNLATKEMYALFPEAPARTVAKIAGTPKPAGCL